MLSREACERRVYRLATLLTGNPTAAAKVIAAVVDAQPDLRQLDSAHMDRLTVLRSREIAPAMIVADDLPRPLAQALSLLSTQQREAWVFAKVYRLSPRDAARAMDCSVAAAATHLLAAEAAMAAVPESESSHPAEALLRYSMTLDVPAFHRSDRQRRRRRVWVMRIVLGAVVIAGLVAAVLWWLRWVKHG